MWQGDGSVTSFQVPQRKPHHAGLHGVMVSVATDEIFTFFCTENVYICVAKIDELTNTLLSVVCNPSLLKIITDTICKCCVA